MKLYLDKIEVEEAFVAQTWQRVLYNEFAATLTSKARPFPCVFGLGSSKFRR